MDKKYLSIVLKDDETKKGGVSFQGETVKEFLEELNLDYKKLSIEKFNIILNTNGILNI